MAGGKTGGKGGGKGGGKRGGKELSDLLDDPSSVSMLKLGDASMASPFTAKSPSVMIVANIIRQGRLVHQLIYVH